MYLHILLIFSFFARNAVGSEKRNELTDTEHVLVFAMKQLNIAIVRQRLMLISNPLSSEFGHFWTRKNLNYLTTNIDGNMIIRNYFRRNGVRVVHETLHGEYLVAMASSTIWELLLNVKFYEYDHDYNYMQPNPFNNYTLDKNISSYVSAIFRVYRAPQYKPQMRKSVFQQVLNSSFEIETNDWSQRDFIVSLWRHHDCGIQGEEKNRPK